MSSFDSYRPPEQPRRRRRRDPSRRRSGPGGSGQGGGGGHREAPVVPEAEFTSYYGRPIVKPAPWEDDVAAYLFLGGLSAGSALLAAGGQLTGNDLLRRNCRYAALTAAGLGTVALIKDLGRPERFLNMLRTFKITSPMSVGSWILVSFSTAAGLAAAGEVTRQLKWDSLAKLTLPLENFGGIIAGLLAPGLAAYTAVLLTNTATPTWSGARDYLPFVFAGSAAMGAGGLAMILTPVSHARPARNLAVLAAGAELVASWVMEENMDETEAEPLHEGEAGSMMRASKVLAGAGGVVAGLSTLAVKRGWRGARAIACAGGAALVVSSVLNRFGVFRAGVKSAKDPRYTVEPQKRRVQENGENSPTTFA